MSSTLSVRMVRYVRTSMLAVTCMLCAASAEQAQSEDPDGVPVLLTKLEDVLKSGDMERFSTLLSPNAPPTIGETLGSKLFVADTTRVVVRERERDSLQGALPGDGFRLIVEIFTEVQTIGRIVTVQLDVRRPRGDPAPDAWRISGGALVTSVDGLNRLTVNASRQLAARNFTLRSQDLNLRLIEGSVFVVDSQMGTSGLVLLGRGQLDFTPAPQTERDQLRLFAGQETLQAEFDTAFVRLNPDDFLASTAGSALTAVEVDPRQLRRARDVFTTESPKSFSLDLGDLSRNTWHLVPSTGDFLVEVRTRRHGLLTYTRSMAEAEDVTLFERARGRDLARYASPEKLRTRGASYHEDDLADYDILDYDVEATISPLRESVEGRTKLRVRIRSALLATMNVRLAESLAVTSVESPELGRLLHLRVRTRDSIVVNLPVMMRGGSEMTLVVRYAGRVPPQDIDRETLQTSPTYEVKPSMPPEQPYLLSSRSYWYAQAPVTDYATATLRITVPNGYECVASGQLTAVSSVPGLSSRAPSKLDVFKATDPVRYLAAIVGRFRGAGKSTIALSEELSPEFGGPVTDVRRPGFRVRDRVTLTIVTHPGYQGRAREASAVATDIVRFYASIIGEAPYSGLTLALVEQASPGGHSPPYLVMLNTPPVGAPVVWRNDPAAFTDFAEFFMAHEIAHQWWGHAVGWKNYHEQWTSEGFAQYFAALYAQHRHGDEMFLQMLRQFRRWALAESDQGPIYLGYRVGQIRGDKRVLRAIVYNKGAAVLHTLRRLVGEETFFAGLRRLYHERKFEKAGTDDLQRAFEAEAGRPLQRFFDRWVYGSGVPQVRYRTTIGEGEVVVIFEQRGEVIFDLPVTVTITYADGRATDTVVAVVDKSIERRIPTDGSVRSVQINRDHAAIAEFETF